MTQSHRLPRYPVYVPSKGRAAVCYTARFLRADDLPFFLVVEPQERDAYAAVFGSDCLLVLPFRNQGSVIPARNWIKQHATANGHARHWQIDDNIRGMRRRWHLKRIPCQAGIALAITEDFVDRYENVAIAGLAYSMFLPGVAKIPPFYLNCHVYSCTLVLNSLPHRWRSIYNEDTDMCLQVLAAGWCTILMNIFCVDKIQTMALRGGNTDALYQGDGRLKMARALERLWPGVVETKRRFKRPQHVINDQWRAFDTPLKLKPGLTLEGLAAANTGEQGMNLAQLKPIRAKSLRDFVRGKQT